MCTSESQSGRGVGTRLVDPGQPHLACCPRPGLCRSGCRDRRRLVALRGLDHDHHCHPRPFDLAVPNDLEALEKDIRESLEQRSSETYNAEYDDQVIETIIEGSTIKYPPQMLENELNLVIQQLESRLANQGLDMDIYLKTRDMDEQGLRDEATPVAESRVKRSLILLEIAGQEEIEVSEEELQEETERTFDSITRYMSDSDRKQFDTPNALLNLTGSIYAEMRMNRTLEYLRDIAKVDLESEETSEEPVEDIKGDADDTEKEAQADQDEIENNELDKNESDLDEVTREGDEQSLDDDEGEADQKNSE